MANKLTQSEILALTPEQRDFLGVKLKGQKPLGRPKSAGFLTKKQGEVAAYLLLNFSAGQISRLMNVGKACTRMHIGDIHRRCGTTSRADLVSFLQQKYGTARHLAWRITRENRGS